MLLLFIGIKKIFSPSPLLPLQTNALPVSLIVSAYNEEKILEEKLKNTIKLSYPSNLLNIIFITDGSTDNSNNIISRYPEIILLHEPERKGKLAAMNRAMQHVKTPIVVFSDANGLLHSNCIENLVRHFSDPIVGCVSGEKKILVSSVKDDPLSKGEGLYWTYESFLKKLDSQLYSTMGAAGELLCMRTELYEMLPTNTIIEDFVQSLQVCIKGKVVRYEPAAVSAEHGSQTASGEMERKIRITAGAFQAMGMLAPLFNVFRFPVVCFQFISHRVLRWTLCPLALPVMLVSSMAIYFNTHSVFYGVATLIQITGYLAAAGGWILVVNHKYNKWLNIAFYLVFMHLCVFAGFYRYLTNKQSVLWRKAPR
ncbi:MAG: glycosyltransferase family 2 protein [Flavitalea sp.]